jgi:predicted peptidase
MMAAGSPLSLVGLAVAGTVFTRPAQTNEAAFTRHSFTRSTTIQYRLFVPRGYISAVEYPIVLSLHGVQERGDDNEAQFAYSLGLSFAEDSVQERYPCFILCPQCPADQFWVGDYPVWSEPPANRSWYLDTIEQRPSKAHETVMLLLDSLICEYSIDRSRQYLTGISMGGCGVWYAITKYPNRFAAAVPLSGIGDTTRAHLLTNTAIWNFHGSADAGVQAAGSRDMTRILSSVTGEPILEAPVNGGDYTANFGAWLDSAAILRAVDEGRTHIYTEVIGVGHSGQVWAPANRLFWMQR